MTEQTKQAFLAIEKAKKEYNKKMGKTDFKTCPYCGAKVSQDRYCHDLEQEIELLEMQLTWRPAETPPAEEGHYLTHMKFKNGDESYSVNRYVKEYGWILFQGFQFVVEWMPIPGKKGE